MGVAAPKVLLIGLDAFDPVLALEWIDSGDLPNLGSLQQRGAWCRTSNPIGMIGSVWPTIATGTSPAWHGRHYKTQIQPGSYGSLGFTPRDLSGTLFWQTLGEAGRRVCVVDVPMTYPVSELNGIHLADWGTHEAEQSGCCSWPPELAREVEARFGERPLAPCYGRGSSLSSVRALIKGTDSSIRIKQRALLELIEREPWDLFMAVFCEAHCVGENCWHLMDAKHPHHDRRLAAKLGNPVLDTYRALDRAVGALVSRAGDESTVLVLASHTMAANFGATDLLPRVLSRLDQGASGGERAHRGLLKLWRMLPPDLRRLLPNLYRRKAKGKLATAGRERKRCFEALNDSAFGAIRINLAGREPNGLVEPGEELESYIAELTASFMALRDADTGKPAVERVHRTSELFSGPRLDGLPDLFVEWRGDGPGRGVRSDEVGVVWGSEQSIKTGNHSADNRGMLLAAGPGVTPGPLGRDVPSTSVSATVASLLGAPLPGAQGEPIAEVSRS